MLWFWDPDENSNPVCTSVCGHEASANGPVPHDWLLGEVTHHLRVGMIFRTGPFQQMEKFSP